MQNFGCCHVLLLCCIKLDYEVSLLTVPVLHAFFKSRVQNWTDTTGEFNLGTLPRGAHLVEDLIDIEQIEYHIILIL